MSSRWRGAARSATAFGLSFGVVALLSLLAFQARPLMGRIETGRWVGQEWREKKEQFARSGVAHPALIVVGDSTATMDIAPSELAPGGFNFGRQGLMGYEFPVVTGKLEAMGIAPRLILVTILPDHFMEQESDRDFLDQPRGRLGTVLAHYYSDSNRSQVQFLPGTRLVKFLLDGALARLDKPDPAYWVEPDGLYAYRYSTPLAGDPELPASFLNDPPGFMKPGLLAPLRGFHDHWAAKGAVLVFLLMPKHPAFLARYRARFAGDEARFRAELDRIFHGRVLDLEDAMPAAAFHDALHLHRDGAHAFGPILGARLRSRGWLAGAAGNGSG